MTSTITRNEAEYILKSRGYKKIHCIVAGKTFWARTDGGREFSRTAKTDIPYSATLQRISHDSFIINDMLQDGRNAVASIQRDMKREKIKRKNALRRVDKDAHIQVVVISL